MPPIPVALPNSGSSAFDGSDNLSVSSVTRKLSLINSSSGEYCFTDNLIPSDTLLAVNISEAISKGDLEGLNQILQNLNTSAKLFTSPCGNLLQISASLSKFEDFKKILLWSGIDPNSQNPNDGSTTIHIATRLSRYDIVEYLLSLPDIDDTIKDKEDSRNFYRENTLKLLFKAVHKQKLKEIQEILKNPRCSLIDFNSQNSYGETILHVAARTENEEIIRLCLKLGVDPFMKNKKGKIAIELSRKPNTRALLKQAPMIRSKEIPLNVSGTRIEGYLNKYTNFAGGFRRRWFVLEHGVISYYNNPSEYPVSCRGSINLEYVEIVPSPSNPCKFDLVGLTKSEVKIHLKADAQDEAKRWIIALKQAKEFYALEPDNEKLPPTNLLNIMNTPEIQNCKSPTLSSSPASPTWSNEIELAFMTLLRLEQLIHEPSSNRFQIMEESITNLKDILGKIEQILTQKNRRLEAQRKEKDLLEDAVRSLALENNKWQTWARGQLIRHDPSVTKSNSPKPVRDQVDVLTSLENHLESTMETKISDEDEEFYDVYDEESDNEDSDDSDEIVSIIDEDTTAIGRDTPRDATATTSYVGINNEITNVDVDEYGYPLMLRNRIPVDSTKMPAISLWNILKNAIRQQDLTRMPIPINFSEPLSMLQRMCEDLEYFDLLESAKSLKDDPARRLVYIAAFAITSYSGTDKRISKPFNPLLGETFELITPKFKYLSEQVSHHPPIGASFCEAEGYEYWNEVHVTSRFRGKYLELRPEGLSHLKFADNNTHYSWNRVNTAVNNIIVGKIYLEHYGKMRIQSHGEDGLIAEIDFLPNGWRKGTSNRIEGKVFHPSTGITHYTITGTWNQSIIAKNPDSESFQVWQRNPSPPDSEIMYNFSSFAMTLNHLTTQLKNTLCPTDSRLRPDQRAMEEGEFDSAGKLKVKLEEKQRKARKLTEADPEFVYKPRWFRRGIDKDTGEGHWEYNGEYWENRKLNQWTSVPNIYL